MKQGLCPIGYTQCTPGNPAPDIPIPANLKTYRGIKG